MANHIQLTNKIIKYLVYALIVYTLFAYVPQKQLPVSDVLLMTTIIIISFVILDFLTPSDHNEGFKIIENLDGDESTEGLETSTLFEDVNDIEPENEENDDKYLNYSKPLVLKELQDQEILSSNEVDEIIKVCNDKDQCSLKLKELLNNDKLNNQQFLELHIVFGLENYEGLQDLYLQDRINREQSYLIAVAISSKSSAFIDSILKKYESDNVITKEDSQKIKNIKIVKEAENNLISDGEKYLSTIIENGSINTFDAKIIHDKCSSASLDSCSIQLNKFKKDKIITNKQAFALLKAYNKPSVDNVRLVDDGEIKGLDKTPDIGDTMKTDKLLESDKLLEQAESIAKDREKEINRLLNENQNLQNILEDKENEDTNEFKEMQKREERIKAECQVDKDNNFKQIQKLLNSKKNKNLKSLYDKNHDMNYNLYSKNETNPLGSYTSDFTNSFTHGFSHLATDKWRPPQYDNSICKIEQECNTCDNDFEGYPVELTKWDQTRKILPRDNIDVSYINEKLNEGKV